MKWVAMITAYAFTGCQAFVVMANACDPNGSIYTVACGLVALFCGVLTGTYCYEVARLER